MLPELYQQHFKFHTPSSKFSSAITQKKKTAHGRKFPSPYHRLWPWRKDSDGCEKKVGGLRGQPWRPAQTQPDRRQGVAWNWRQWFMDLSLTYWGKTAVLLVEAQPVKGVVIYRLWYTHACTCLHIQLFIWTSTSRIPVERKSSVCLIRMKYIIILIIIIISLIKIISSYFANTSRAHACTDVRTRTLAHMQTPTHDRHCSLCRWRDNGRSATHWNKLPASNSVCPIVWVFRV